MQGFFIFVNSFLKIFLFFFRAERLSCAKRNSNKKGLRNGKP